MKWEKFSIDSKPVFKRYYGSYAEISDYSFTNFFIWSFGREIEYCEENGSFIVKIKYPGEQFPFLLMPAGENKMELLEKLEKEFSEKGFPFIIKSVSESMKLEMETGFRDRFIFYEERDRFDYIYSVKELIELSGKKYHKKKNLLNNFIKNYSYEYIKFNGENIKDAEELQKKWCSENQCSLDLWLSTEEAGILKSIENFENLDIVAAGLKIEGKLAAFTIGERVSNETAVIHIEKGDSSFTGIYQAMNNLFLKNEFSDLKYVNREEDLGIEGLRQSKLSYNPVMFGKKYRAELKK